MQHKVLLFGFLCGLLNTTHIMFGMESPRTVTIFYAKDCDNKYYLFDKKGLHTNYSQHDFPHPTLPSHHSHTNLHYNSDNHTYSLINNGKILSSGTLTTLLINTLRTNLKHHTLYARIDNKHCVHIKHILTTTTDTESLDSIIEQLKKDNNIDIIEVGNFNQKAAVGPSYITIAKTLALLMLIVAIRYAHHLPQLLDKIITIKNNLLSKTAQ